MHTQGHSWGQPLQRAQAQGKGGQGVPGGERGALETANRLGFWVGGTAGGVGAQLGRRQGRAGWKGEGGCMPHPHPWNGGLPPLAHPGQVPTIQLRVCITFWALPGATAPVWVMTARRERREDAWHGGCCQPAPGKAAPLPDWCPPPGLPPSGSSTWGPGFIWWLAPAELSPSWLLFCPDRQPHPSPSPPGCLAPLSVPACEQEQGTPHPTRLVPVGSHRGQRSHPEQEQQPHSSSQAIKCGGSRRRLQIKSVKDPRLTLCPSPGLPPGPALRLWDTHSPKPPRAASAPAIA